MKSMNNISSILQKQTIKSIGIIISIVISFFISSQPTSAQVSRTIGKTLKRSTAKTIKIATKKGISEIPVGKESLKVIAHADGSFKPVINNLGENASKYSAKFNKKLLLQRRKAITEAYQFISTKDLSKTKAKGNLVEPSSRRKLRENIYARMSAEYSSVAKAFGGTEAHHVVEGNAKSAAKSREILKKFGIGINDAENGVLLRSDDNSIYRGALHNTSHDPKYSEYVFSKIKNSKSKAELISKLTEIKKDLVSGKLDLKGNYISTSQILIFE